jgi:hypothetical protein
MASWPQPHARMSRLAWPKHDTKGLHQSADLVVQRGPHRNQSAARGEQKPNAMAFDAFHFDLAVPAAAHDLRETERIVGIGLVQLQHESSFGVPGMDADHRQSRCSQGMPMPYAKRAGFERNAHNQRSALTDESLNLLGSRGALTLPDPRAFLIDHANSCFFSETSKPTYWSITLTP